jgi:hypothetical protein
MRELTVSFANFLLGEVPDGVQVSFVFNRRVEGDDILEITLFVAVHFEMEEVTAKVKDFVFLVLH